MHFVIGPKSYKTILGIVIQALGKINEIAVKVGDIHYLITYMIVDTNNYDLLFGIRFFD
jgi:hypothetical protein